MQDRIPESGSPSSTPDGADEPAAYGPSTKDLPQRNALPFHPVVMAAFPVLSLYAHNIAEVPASELWPPLGWALLGSVAVWTVVALLIRHVRKAALAASAIILVFFSYGHVSNLLPDNLHAAAGPLCIAALTALLYAVYRSRGRLAQATAVVNVASLALIVPSCVTIGTWLAARASETTSSGLFVHAYPDRARFRTAGDGKTDDSALPRPGQVPGVLAGGRPDIYYIVLDAYGRADSLKEFYGYDNTPFVRALEERGFYVARHSRANYAQTSYCLPVSLNMSYLDGLLEAHGPTENRFETLRERIDKNAVAAYLRGQGYRYVNIWTGSAITRVDTADLKLGNNSLAPPTSFAGQVLSLTMLDATPPTPQISKGIAGEYDLHRAFIRTAFTSLDSVAKLPYPKFVFAHILAPHPPFVFGSNGEAINPRYPYNEADGSQLLRMHQITRQEYKSRYIGQLQYINGRVLEAVDAIIRQSDRPPIIIVQGDHGSRLNVDWDSQARTDLREPFSILNAYRVPAQVRRHLYDTITPVNSFRVLLTNLFGADYPVLPDHSFFAAAGQPLNFSEVTHLIPEFKTTESPKPDARLHFK